MVQKLLGREELSDLDLSEQIYCPDSVDYPSFEGNIAPESGLRWDYALVRHQGPTTL
jgi:hypothetical protein